MKTELLLRPDPAVAGTFRLSRGPGARDGWTRPAAAAPELVARERTDAYDA